MSLEGWGEVTLPLPRVTFSRPSNAWVPLDTFANFWQPSKALKTHRKPFERKHPWTKLEEERAVTYQSPLAVVGGPAVPYQSPLAVVAGRIGPIMINQTIAALTSLRINPLRVAVFFLTLLAVAAAAAADTSTDAGTDAVCSL